LDSSAPHPSQTNHLQFWSLPESAEDIFSLISPSDIRRVRDSAPENLQTLLLSLTSRLFVLRHHPAFPDAELAPAKEALNCIRVLTRIFPFLFETDDLGEWQHRFWWTPQTRAGTTGWGVPKGEGQEERETLFNGGQQEGDIPLVSANASRSSGEDVVEKKPLAGELLDTLLDFLSFAGFTVLATTAPNGGSKVTMAIW
jgi:hypothetical protein